MLKYYLTFLGIYLPLSETQTIDLIYRKQGLYNKYLRGVLTWNELRQAYYKQKYLFTEAGIEKKGLFDA